jgi:NADH-quinone oxidoreductase subunit J
MSAPWIIPTATVVTGAALWLMLPRARMSLRPFGALLGAIALGLWASLVAWPDGAVGDVAFGLVAGVTLISAVGAVTFRNPVYCAIWFALTLLGTAGLFLLSGAQFLAVATIVVYAGAILVTYVFVIMLAAQASEPGETSNFVEYDAVAREPLVAVAAGFLLLAVLLSVAFSPRGMEAREAGPTDRQIIGTILTERPGAGAPAANGRPVPVAELRLTNTERIGLDLFRGHPLGLELAGVILLVSLIGAVVIAMSEARRPGDGGGHE